MPQPPQPAPPLPRFCIICSDEYSELDTKSLIKPCRICPSDYCHDCLHEMFVGATTDSTRMPPRCCTFLQLHTAIAALTDQEASNYRATLEEWITLEKVYCPAPTCSAYISERLIPVVPTNDETDGIERRATTLQTVLLQVVDKVSATPAARFFRGELDITMLPGYTTVVTNHVDLTTIREHVEADGYTAASDLTTDMALIVSNAKTYNKVGHPVAVTADELFQCYLDELAAAVDRLVDSSSIPPIHPIATQSRMFACPKCHIGICTECKQIEHGTAPCDTTSADAELAMLETFHYKRCPLCKHGVRKMFGCSHMQCVCGAHWCYWCSKSINQCDGGCEARDESEDEGEDEDEDEEEFSDEDESVEDPSLVDVSQRRESAPSPTVGPEEALGDAAKPVIGRSAEQVEAELRLALLAPAGPQPGNATSNNEQPRFPPNGPPLPSQPAPPPRTINLDAGGSRRWGETDFDFGDEPEEDGSNQVWSCTHEFGLFYSKDDTHNHGDEGKMECNRCFDNVKPTKPPPPAPVKVLPSSKKRYRRHSTTVKVAEPTVIDLTTDDATGGAEDKQQAYECHDCRLVVCMTCRDKYLARQKEREEL